MLTIDLKDLLICILILAAIALVIYALVMLVRFAPSLQRLDKILADMEVVTATASKRTKQFDGAIDNFSKSFSGISKKVKEGQNIMAAISIILSMFSNIATALKKDGDKDKGKAGQEAKAKG
ncbi:MAG: hypothetical protein LBR44_09205 [Clostridiales Family XIII bacterium]|jgi:hypothetical protein|nr:hypothetical protein [Clostridiales Family XIII bacterium]